MNIRIVDKLKNLNIEIYKRIIAISKDFGIKKLPSPLQMNILKYLIESSDKKICQKDLEIALNISKATISETLKKMEKEGIIERLEDENDHRSKMIRLTDLSLEQFKTMDKSFEQLNLDLVENISMEEMEIFLSVIAKMQENLKKERK